MCLPIRLHPKWLAVGWWSVNRAASGKRVQMIEMKDGGGDKALLGYQARVLEGIRDLCDAALQATEDDPPDLWDLWNTLAEHVEDLGATLLDEGEGA